jgi:hypothetical protein
MHYNLLLFVVVFLFLMALACSSRLQKQRSTKHTNSRQRTASHSRRRSSTGLRSRRTSRASRASIHAGSSDADTIASRSLHASAGTSSYSGGDDAAGSSASLAARPSGPRRIGAPRTACPTAPGGSRACAAAPPACPRTFGPRAGGLGGPWAPAVACAAERSCTVAAVPATGAV